MYNEYKKSTHTCSNARCLWCKKNDGKRKKLTTFPTFNVTFNLYNAIGKKTQIKTFKGKNLKLSWRGKICPLFFAKLLQIWQIAMASPVHSPLQFTPQVFNGIQVWTLAGPFQNLNLIPVKPFFCWFGCALLGLCRAERWRSSSSSPFEKGADGFVPALTGALNCS